MRLKLFVRLLLVGAALAGLAAAGAWSIRTGWADYRIRQRTIAGTEEAIAIAPGNAEYSAQLAMLTAGDDPPRAKAALERAVSLNPRHRDAWIALGLEAEQQGDSAAAQRLLLLAAGADKTFLPRWTLANYYLRQDNATEFWFWAKEALAMVSGDAQPLFRLSGRLEEDGKLIDRLGVQNPDVRAAYLSYLLGQRRVDLIGPALGRVLDENREADVPLLLTACERLLDQARVDQAADLWERMAQARRVPSRTPVGNGQLLVNGDFATPPTSEGLDWRMPGTDGVGVSLEGESQGLRITFSGGEPEDFEAIAQLVPVRANQRYELQFTHRTAGIAPHAGLVWRLSDTGGALLGAGPSLASEMDSDGHLHFETPPECRMVRLSLRYDRAPGTTRIEGFVVLRKVVLRLAAQAPTSLGGRIKK